MSMMQITPTNGGLIRKMFSVALISGTAMLLSFPGYAFGQSGVTSATRSLTPVPNERKSSPVEQGESNGLKVFALRLRPGQDLRQEIERFTKESGLKAGFIITTVGSLEKATLRLADQNSTSSFAGKFEIVSLVGTLSKKHQTPNKYKNTKTMGCICTSPSPTARAEPSAAIWLKDVRFTRRPKSLLVKLEG
jgi:hypothetical protein